MSEETLLSRRDSDLIIDDEGPERICTRPDLHFHRFVVRITESTIFNSGIMVTIVLNALAMAVETDAYLKSQYRTLFVILDELFLGIYTLEFLMKIYAEPIRYFYSSYNVFDFFVLFISYVQIVWAHVGGTTNLNGLRTLRALRTLRTLRTVSFVRGLQMWTLIAELTENQSPRDEMLYRLLLHISYSLHIIYEEVLVTALIDTIKRSVISVVLLLCLLMFLFAIMGYYFFGYKEENSDKEHWGDLGAAMLTLFSFVTVDGWTDLQGELDKLGMTGSRIYTIIFIFLGHFIFTNVFIAMIIMNIHEATESFRIEQELEREQTVQRKKEYMIHRQHSEVRQMLEKQTRGDYSNFYDMVKTFQSTLRHDDYLVTVDLATNLVWIETYIHLLDHQDDTMYRLQQLHFEMCNLFAIVMEKKLKQRYGM